MVKFSFNYAKKLLILGVAMLLIGLAIIGVLLQFPQIETVGQTSIDMTTTGWYNSEKFRAENGYWLELDVSSSGASVIYVRGQTVGEIFKVEGSTYKYSVPIQSGDVYEVLIENKEGHSEGFIFTTWVPHENHYSGNLYLKRTPAYSYQAVSLGAILSVIGLVMVLSVVYVEYRTRQKIKSTYECPRCAKTVSIGLEKCPYCKIDLTKYWVRCKYCKKLYDSHLDRCPRCGAQGEDY